MHFGAFPKILTTKRKPFDSVLLIIVTGAAVVFCLFACFFCSFKQLQWEWSNLTVAYWARNRLFLACRIISQTLTLEIEAEFKGLTEGLLQSHGTTGARIVCLWDPRASEKDAMWMELQSFSKRCNDNAFNMFSAKYCPCYCKKDCSLLKCSWENRRGGG